MAAAEGLADLGQAQAHHFPHQIHGDLAGHGDIMVAAGALQVVHGDAVIGGHGFLDQLGADGAGVPLEQLLEGFLGQLHVHGAAGEAGVGCQTGQAAFQLAYVGVDALGDQLQHIIGDDQVLKLGLLAQNGQTGLEVGALDVSVQAALEAAAQALLQLLDLPGRLVAGHDDLLARLLEVVEGVEELLLRGALAGNELDIVHHEDIGSAETVTELLVAVGLHGGDQLVGKVLAGDVDDVHLRMQLVGIVADGVHEMGLAKAHAAVDEQGVVCLRGHLGHRQGYRVGEPVAAAHHEGIEGVLGVQVGQTGACLLLVQLPHAVLQLVGAEHLHGEGLACGLAHRFGDVGQETLDADIHDQLVDALEQQVVIDQRMRLEGGFHPGFIADAVHFLLQRQARRGPDPFRFGHIFNPFWYKICIIATWFSTSGVRKSAFCGKTVFLWKTADSAPFIGEPIISKACVFGKYRHFSPAA